MRRANTFNLRMVGGIAVVATLLTAPASAQITVIEESGTSSAYGSGFPLTPSPNPTGFTSSWTELNTGGGRFIATTSGQQVGSGRSWGIFSGTGTDYAIGRALSNAAAVGSISLVMRHNVDNGDDFTGFNLKTTSSATFGTSELLSVGLTPAGGNQAVRYNPGTPASLSFGEELRGQVMSYTASWNTIQGTFAIAASRNGATPLTASGSLASGTPVSAFGFGNFNSGSDQDVIWNDISVSIPEPAQYRTAVPTVGANEGSFTYTAGSNPQSLTLGSPTQRGYVTLNSTNALPTGLPQFALAVPAGSVTVVKAFLDSRASVNGYTATTTPPAWVSQLSTPSIFNIFLQYSTTGAGTRYAYWDFSPLGVSVSDVALVPEPTTAGFALVAGVWALGRRRGR